MECPMCRKAFDEKLADAACQGCPLAVGNCGMVKCPECDYEMPRHSRILSALKALRGKK